MVKNNQIIRKGSLAFLLVAVILLGLSIYFLNSTSFQTRENTQTQDPLFAKFQLLSTSGNSACSGSFNNSIDTMKDNARLQGSCCSPMSWHRYQEQIKGLGKYKSVKEIPSDPYDIEAGLAKKLKEYYDDKLTEEQQKQYDYAMANSEEKGPCCCKCWRWYVYGGLAKILIKEKGFTEKQITEIWNLSDGCGGEGDHVNHG